MGDCVKAHIHEYLGTFREDVPQWLADYKSGDYVDFSHFMNSRIGYYPGAGYDVTLIIVGNKSHSVHCFLHADYGIRRDEMEKHISKAGCIMGYHSIGRVDWSDTINVEGYMWCPEYEPYCSA